MARTQKFSEDLLLEAVIKYAENETGKIKATELASWAAINITGLEGVRDYHFMRQVKELDPRTGKQTARKKACTVRIEEINRARSLTENIKRNALLKASTIDAFMEQPEYVQRRQVAETRETVDKILVKNSSLIRENESLHAENRYLKTNLLELSEKMDIIQKEQTLLSRKVTFLMKATDEGLRKSMLTQIGIDDGDINLDTYTQSLSLKIRDVLDINKAILKHIQALGDIVDKDVDTRNAALLSDNIISGIRFEEKLDE